MNYEFANRSTEELLKLIQELEHNYTEAFADDAEPDGLVDIWKQIKTLRNEISKRVV